MVQKSLFSGYSHSYDTGIAAHFNDLTVATVLNHIIFWLRFNRSEGINQIDGKTWMFNTFKSMANYFGYLNERQIQNAVQKLLAEGILIKKEFNKSKFDRTSWYSLADESCIIQKQVTKEQNCSLEEPNLRLEEPKLFSPKNKNVCSIYKDKDKRIKKENNSPGKAETNISSSNEPKKEKPFDIESDAYRLAVKLESSIKSHIPDFKAKSLNAWAKDFDLMLRLDKRNIAEIESIIDWLPTDWNKDKVFCAYKLRERFIELRSQMQKSPARKTSENCIETNRKYAISCEKALVSNNFRIDILSSSVEIVPLRGSILPDVLKFSELGFKEQMDNILRKREFKQRNKK